MFARRATGASSCPAARLPVPRPACGCRRVSVWIAQLRSAAEDRQGRPSPILPFLGGYPRDLVVVDQFLSFPDADHAPALDPVSHWIGAVYPKVIRHSEEVQAPVISRYPYWPRRRCVAEPAQVGPSQEHDEPGRSTADGHRVITLSYGHGAGMGRLAGKAAWSW